MSITCVIYHYLRLGVNFNHLPVNRPLNTVTANIYRDGHMIYDNDGGMPNYNPNSFMRASAIPQYKESAYKLDDVIVDRHEPPNDNFFQVRRKRLGLPLTSGEWYQ